jgi:hypothetical protein
MRRSIPEGHSYRKWLEKPMEPKIRENDIHRDAIYSPENTKSFPEKLVYHVYADLNRKKARSISVQLNKWVFYILGGGDRARSNTWV